MVRGTEFHPSSVPVGSLDFDAERPDCSQINRPTGQWVELVIRRALRFCFFLMLERCHRVSAPFRLSLRPARSRQLGEPAGLFGLAAHIRPWVEPPSKTTGRQGPMGRPKTWKPKGFCGWSGPSVHLASLRNGIESIELSANPTRCDEPNLTIVRIL